MSQVVLKAAERKRIECLMLFARQVKSGINANNQLPMRFSRKERKGRIRSFMYAISGIAATVKSERNMRIHLAAAVTVVLLGAWLGLDGREWAEIVICCALVMSLECLNTAVEAVVDLASPNIHPLAKKAKDCAAGAVLVAAIGAAIVGCIIFLPKLYE